MDIGHAANALKLGKRVARNCWPLGQWIVVVPGSTFPVTADRPVGIAAPELIGDTVKYRTHIDMHSARGGNSLGPWHPHGDDILADDWQIV